MYRDLRETPLYREAKALYSTVRRPGTGQISDALEVHVAPSGHEAVFTGVFTECLEGTPATRICRIDLVTSEIRVLTFGSHADRLPKYSPDGRYIGFLSDRKIKGEHQLYLLNLQSGITQPVPPIDGLVEYFQWAPDGKQILLGVADRGSDLAGMQGATTSTVARDSMPSWMPKVECGGNAYGWRRLWVYDVAANCARKVGPADRNIWEAAWCGCSRIVAVTSNAPTEGSWYAAHLEIIYTTDGKTRELYRGADQIGMPAGSPSGALIAFVEAVCSDRWIVAGNLRLIDVGSGNVVDVETDGVDITYVEWRSDDRLLLAGHREFDTVVGVYDVGSTQFKEVWSSHDLSTGGIYVSTAGVGDSGDCVLIGESFSRSPEIATIRSGEYQALKSFDLGYVKEAAAIHSIEQVRWTAPDGLQLHGWLLRPAGGGPHPLIMSVHGGPVWQWHPLWLGRGGIAALMLIQQGYAIFFPNPRGSTGRGTEFARRVVGDIGGADSQDCLSGIEFLVGQGIADPKRLGLTGISYGGFMTSWLITQDARFAAAVPVSPVTNQVTEHLISNIPRFVSIFMADTYTNPKSKYFERSPVCHAHKVCTPTLNICGALDKCTPPEEALQFHNALLENGVKSVLVTYPEEGHGVRKLPAAIDYAARVVGWFLEHMPPSAGQ